ncbi:MAG: T9SS type A sorting domain-containing protein, partial [Ignavibacteriaceae bacterium]
MKFFNNNNRLIAVHFIFLTLSILLPINSYAQNYSVNGVVSTSKVPVKYASVSFVDNIDTTNKFSTITNASGQYQFDIITFVELTDNQPVNFELEQNYPNPFSSSTAIPYKLNEQSDVSITIYDILGRELKKFTIGVQPSGVYGVVWDGRNNFGEKAATGIYFYRLQAGGETQVKKMIFGTGDNKLTVSLHNISSSNQSEKENGLHKFQYGGNYTVRIENTDSTFPAITPIQIENVVIESDTTLDYSVTEAAVVYLDSTKQVISGFGANNIVPWRPDMTADEIQKAFGTGDGQIGFTVLRLRVPWDQNEFSLNVTTPLAAQNMGVRIIASPWTAPPEIKTNNNIVGGRLSDTSYASYAEHLKSFSDYLAANGIQLSAISVQ